MMLLSWAALWLGAMVAVWSSTRLQSTGQRPYAAVALGAILIMMLGIAGISAVYD